jgi:hypothetical protein
VLVPATADELRVLEGADEPSLLDQIVGGIIGFCFGA